MVRSGDADGMVSGAMCTTANTIRPALQVGQDGGEQAAGQAAGRQRAVGRDGPSIGAEEL